MRSEMPRGWKWTRIGQHFLRVRRKNTVGVKLVLTASGKHGLIDQEEFFNKRIAAAKLGGYFHLKRGEFAYNRSSMKGYPCGAIKRLDRYDDGVLSTLYLCFGLRSSPGMLSDYAAQLFDSGQLDDELRPIARVGARAHGLLNVTPDDFMDVSFPLPPLPEQKKIATILSSVDEAIKATQAVIEQMGRVREGLLQDLLTRGIGHTRFKQTEIGEIPERWGVTDVDSVASKVTVGHVGTTSKHYREVGVPFLRTANVRRMYVDDGSLVHISEDFDRTLRKSQLRTGDVLIARVGANRGMAAVLPSHLDGANCANIVVVKPSPSLEGRYLAYLVNSRFGQEALLGVSAGSAQGVINTRAVQRWRIPLPDPVEQRELVRVLRKTDEMLAKEAANLSALEQLKTGLLQDLLTGKVRVAV